MHGGPVVPPRMRALGGRHILTIDVKEPLQCERLGLGVGLAVRRVDEPGGELVRLPLPRASPSRCLSDRGEPSAVLSPLYLEEAGLRVGKDPHPVPAPFAGAVAAPTSFRACHHSIPLVDGLHDLRERKFACEGVFDQWQSCPTTSEYPCRKRTMGVARRERAGPGRRYRIAIRRWRAVPASTHGPAARGRWRGRGAFS